MASTSGQCNRLCCRLCVLCSRTYLPGLSVPQSAMRHLRTLSQVKADMGCWIQDSKQLTLVPYHRGEAIDHATQFFRAHPPVLSRLHPVPAAITTQSPILCPAAPGRRISWGTPGSGLVGTAAVNCVLVRKPILENVRREACGRGVQGVYSFLTPWRQA